MLKRRLFGESSFESLEARFMLAGENPLTCEQVRDLDLPDTVIRSTRHVNADPPYCLVFGRIEGNIGFVWTMPDHEAWEEKMLHLGLGGFAGALPDAGIQRADLLRRGYAYGGSNLGHYSDGLVATWAWDQATGEFNEKTQIDFGYHATHITAVITRQITEAYYDQQVDSSFFEGCSMGGRQGVVSAQRYPEDFDGIIAGAPGFAWTDSMLTAIAIQQVMFPDPDNLSRSALPANKMPALEEAVLSTCDGVDGLEDGIVTDPRACIFTPKEHLPECEPGQDNNSCFTAAQIDVVEAVFQGASNSSGQLYPGFPAAGAEYSSNQGNNWKEWFISYPSIGYPNLNYAFAAETLRYFVYGDPNYNLQDFDFETDVPDLARASAIIDGLDTDLTPFQEAGGRMLIWHGWADSIFPAEGMIQYYEDVASTMGGKQNVDDFFRLFMMPGVTHCGGGNGPDTVDWLGVLEQWVEEDAAPDEVIATGGTSLAQSRPLCPYPQIAIYDGVGDSRTADAFSCGSPEAPPLPGDSNHDGIFDSSDLVLVLAAGKYEDGIPDNATFDEGDWNGDGDFDTGDLVYALAEGHYESTPAPAMGTASAIDWLFSPDEYDKRGRAFVA